MEVVRDKKLNRIIFLICVVLVMMTCKFASAQGKLQKDKEFVYVSNGDYYFETTMYTPDHALSFPYNVTSKEYISIGIAADSVDVKGYKMRIYAYLPQQLNVKQTNLIINFEDGTKMVYPIVKVDEDNYVEFKVNPSGASPLCTKKAVSLEFLGIGKFKNTEDKSYFIDFLRELSRI
jgi:hypothetical protein